MSNKATYSHGGGGIAVKYINLGTTMRMKNSIVMSNVASGNANLYYDSYAPAATTNVSASNSCFTCTLDLPGSSNNIAADPKFANFAGQNFRLTSGSPCRNTGLNMAWMEGAFDLDGLNRIREGRVDMGCYEYLLCGTMIMLQ